MNLFGLVWQIPECYYFCKFCNFNFRNYVKIFLCGTLENKATGNRKKEGCRHQVTGIRNIKVPFPMGTRR